MQKKRHSFLESCVSTLVGFLLSWVIQIVVFPLYGVYISMAQNIQILVIFTIASVVRQYVLRRVFNHFTGRGI